MPRRITIRRTIRVRYRWVKVAPNRYELRAHVSR